MVGLINIYDIKRIGDSVPVAKIPHTMPLTKLSHYRLWLDLCACYPWLNSRLPTEYGFEFLDDDITIERSLRGRQTPCTYTRYLENSRQEKHPPMHYTVDDMLETRQLCLAGGYPYCVTYEYSSRKEHLGYRFNLVPFNFAEKHYDDFFYKGKGIYKRKIYNDHYVVYMQSNNQRFAIISGEYLDSEHGLNTGFLME